jgi:hypothetical protein
MNLKDSFTQGYEEGRQDTRQVMAGRQPDQDYAAKLIRPFFILGYLIVGPIVFLWEWIGNHVNFFLAIFYGWLGAMVLVVAGLVCWALPLYFVATRMAKRKR